MFQNALSAIVFIYPISIHWDPVMHIWVGNLTSMGSDNGLSPGRRQAIILTNAGKRDFFMWQTFVWHSTMQWFLPKWALMWEW